MKEFFYSHCKCTRVVDGDTLDVEFDVGFDFKTKQRLRLYGIDAPERNSDTAAEATSFVMDACFNNPFQVATYKKDSFGRWLSVVYVNGKSLNDQLVEKGLAEPYIP